MNRRILLIAIFCIGAIIIPNLFGYPPAAASSNLASNEIISDAFDPALYKKLNTVDALVDYINSTYKGQKNSTDFLRYVSKVITLRFYHGYSYYTMNDNWVAALSSLVVWDDLSAIVLPDDILKHPKAACSQQSIVMMECAKRYGMDFREILFDHHFALEIKMENKWNYVDVNQEVICMNKSLDDILKEGSLLSLYKNKIEKSKIETILANPKYGKVNFESAPNAVKFQELAGWLSSYFFVIVFFLQILIYFHFKVKSEKLNIQ
jgi:hypothetical protein